MASRSAICSSSWKKRTGYGAHVKIAPRTTELLLQRAEYIPGEGAPLFELRPPVLAGSEWALKRGFDLVVSSVVVVAGLPLWAGDRCAR